MPTILIRIIAGAVALLVLTVAGMFVLQLGPFNTRPSAAAKQLPKVEKAVAATQAKEAAAVGEAETKTKAKAAATEQRTETHVAKVNAAPRPPAPDFPDREFRLSVCQSVIYAGSPDCGGVGGQPEGDRPSAGAGAVRRR